MAKSRSSRKQYSRKLRPQNGTSMPARTNRELVGVGWGGVCAGHGGPGARRAPKRGDKFWTADRLTGGYPWGSLGPPLWGPWGSLGVLGALGDSCGQLWAHVGSCVLVWALVCSRGLVWALVGSCGLLWALILAKSQARFPARFKP